jgi:hypothetical protein
MNSERLGLYQEIEAERKAQDERWGGPNHDDGHTASDWAGVIDVQLLRAVVSCPERPSISNLNPEQRATFRRHMVCVAAVAVASIEVCDRAELEDEE